MVGPENLPRIYLRHISIVITQSVCQIFTTSDWAIIYVCSDHGWWLRKYESRWEWHQNRWLEGNSWTHHRYVQEDQKIFCSWHDMLRDGSKGLSDSQFFPTPICMRSVMTFGSDWVEDRTTHARLLLSWGLTSLSTNFNSYSDSAAVNFATQQLCMGCLNQVCNYFTPVTWI